MRFPDFKFIISIIFFLMINSGCEKDKIRVRAVDFYIPPQIKVNIEELKSLKIPVKTDNNSSITLRVVIYSYSSGKETISMSGGSGFKTDTSAGRIKALAQFVYNGRIVKVEFFEVSGAGKDELLENLVKAVLQMTGG